MANKTLRKTLKKKKTNSDALEHTNKWEPLRSRIQQHAFWKSSWGLRFGNCWTSWPLLFYARDSMIANLIFHLVSRHLDKLIKLEKSAARILHSIKGKANDILTPLFWHGTLMLFKVEVITCYFKNHPKNIPPYPPNAKLQPRPETHSVCEPDLTPHHILEPLLNHTLYLNLMLLFSFVHSKGARSTRGLSMLRHTCYVSSSGITYSIFMCGRTKIIKIWKCLALLSSRVL